MVRSATQSAEMVTMELVQSAGKVAQMSSEMMEHTATSQSHMEEELDPSTNAKIVRNGELFGTQSAGLASTTWPVVSARQTAHPV